MSLLPGPISPYASFDLLLSSFGKTKRDFSNTTLEQFQKDIESNARFGFGVGAGAEFRLLENADIDVSLKYNFNNVIGKEDSEKGINSFTANLTLLFKIY